MKKFTLTFLITSLIFLTSLTATAGRLGENVYRVGDKTGSNIEFQLNTGRVRWNNATSEMEFSDDGVIFKSFDSLDTSVANESSNALDNVGLAVAIGSGVVSVDLKQKDGSTDPSSSNPAKIAFQNAPTPDGSYSIISMVSPTGLVIPNGATLGSQADLRERVYVYAVNNGGAVELAVSNAYLDNESITYDTVTLDGTSDLADGLYTLAPLSDVSIRVIGNFISQQTLVGDWNTADQGVMAGSFDETFSFSCSVDNNGTATIATRTGQCPQFASVFRSSAGRVTTNIVPGTFFKPPVCQCNPTDVSAAKLVCTENTGEFTTDSNTWHAIITNGSTAVDGDFNIQCEGFR